MISLDPHPVSCYGAIIVPQSSINEFREATMNSCQRYTTDQLKQYHSGKAKALQKEIRQHLHTDHCQACWAFIKDLCCPRGGKSQLRIYPYRGPKANIGGQKPKKTFLQRFALPGIVKHSNMGRHS
ncbi:MAG: hypothetical protein HY221_01170 [Candidatus Sungbacteria bacterium]|uniref:Uncharacterized protein n=1 Tax=Candidatus Sungiibacteriota bacterium TaxID=2750080 RepID=A0A932QY48_9BACT|nr:hypothetical protein [Candidatus Sungbacteria bacterium]